MLEPVAILLTPELLNVVPLNEIPVPAEYVVLLSGIVIVVALPVDGVNISLWPLALSCVNVYVVSVVLVAPSAIPSNFFLSAALIKPEAVWLAGLYVVLLSGIVIVVGLPVDGVNVILCPSVESWVNV